MSALPRGWTDALLGELCDVIRGVTFPATAKELEKTSNNVCCLRTKNVQRELDWTDVYFIPKAFVKRDDQLVQAGDILMSMANSYDLVGKVAVARSLPYETAFGAFLSAVRPTASLHGQYLFHFLRSDFAQRSLREGSSQTTNIANISVGTLSTIPVPVPPLAEQKRIADTLDRLLARVDACRERLDRVPAILTRFRQSVLAAATSGELTREWREERGRRLDDWTTSTVGQTIGRVEAGLNVQCEERPPTEGERGLVKISAVTWGTYDDDESKTLPRTAGVPEHARIRLGDFLISRANTLDLVGACVIVHRVTRVVFLSDKVLRLVMPDELKPWLLIALQAPAGRREIEARASGNQLSMRNLSQANLREIPIPVPPADERAEIVRRVTTLLDAAVALGKRQLASATSLRLLAPAILAKAFRGELVPQNPNDEPAAALLARVRSEARLPRATPIARSPRRGRRRTR